MANVPTVPTPSVGAGAAPLPSAPLGAFGAASIGASLAEFGKTAEGASDALAQRAEQVATLDAKAASDNASVELDKKQASAMEEYRANNLGIKASQNLGGIYKSLTDLREAQKANLTSPLAQRMYDEATRLNTVKLQNGLASWAADQRKTYNVEQYKSAADLISRGTTLANFDDQMGKAAVQFRAVGAELGWSDAQYQAALTDFQGKTAYGLIQGMAAKNPEGAQAAFDKYSAGMLPQEKGVLQNQIQASVDNHTVARVADSTFAVSSMHATQNAATVRDAFAHQGWSATDAAAITGVLSGESGLSANPAGHNDGGAAYGVAQWHADRQADFAAWAGHPIQQSTLPEQLAFVNYELSQGKYKAVGDAVRAAPTMEAKAAILVRQFERPADQSDRAVAGRVRLAQQALRAGAPTDTDMADGLETNAGAGLAAIQANPALHGDPILINQATSQYLTNISQARAVANMADQGRLERLWNAAMKDNISDPSKLQGAYPGALADLTGLSAKGRRTFEGQLSTFGNQQTAERTENFLEIHGGLVSPISAAEYAHRDLSKENLTRQQYVQLRELQQNVLAKSAKASQAQANVTSALQLDPVKQALDARPDLKPGSPAYNQFTGAFSEAMQERIDAQGGKKLSEKDKAQIAIGLLAAKPAHWTDIFGLGLRGASTTINAPIVPIEEANNIRAQVRPSDGHILSDWEVGQIYQRNRFENGR